MRAHHHHRASPVAKKPGMDRKFNVGNLSARRATSSMARALGTKHEPRNRTLANGQRAINEPVVLSIYSIGWHLGYPIPTDPKSIITAEKSPDFGCYLISTVAPAAANSAFTFSASSFETFSLILAGTPSTSFLASISDAPVMFLTIFTTSSFLSPNAVMTTSNSVWAASGAAAAPPPAPAGIIIM